jgi:anti-anti-sigma factor
MEMRQEELEGGVLKIALDGSFDIAGAADVDLQFGQIAGKRDRVFVDFSDVDFLASMGIRVMIKAAKAMANHGGKLVVVNPNSAARKVMNATGLDSIVPVVDNEAEALASLT